MNRIVAGLGAMFLIMGMTSCSFFQRGATRRAVSVNDSVKSILSNPQFNDSTKIALANNLLKGETKVAAVIDTTHKDTATNVVVNPVIKADSTQPVASDNNPALLTELAPVWDSRMAYNTFNGKAKVHYEGKDDKQDFTATIRMEKDKKIWVSIVALGLFEAARALITPDSIIVIDRMHKEAKLLAFKDAGKLLPVNVDFATLQSLLIGEALHVSTDRPTNATMLADGLLLIIKNDKYEQELSYNKPDTTIRQQQLKIAGNTGAQIDMKYADYMVTDGKHFANGRVIDIKDTTGNYHIEMDFNKADFNQDLDFSFSVPSKYTRK